MGEQNRASSIPYCIFLAYLKMRSLISDFMLSAQSDVGRLKEMWLSKSIMLVQGAEIENL